MFLNLLSANPLLVGEFIRSYSVELCLFLAGFHNLNFIVSTTTKSIVLQQIFTFTSEKFQQCQPLFD
jgi:hypothetical protein